MKDHRQHIKLTKKSIDKLTKAKSGKGKIILSDTEVPGFRLVAGQSTRTFILEKRITGVGGSARKMKIGLYPVISPEEARETARRWSIFCRDGQDPTKVQAESRNGQVIYKPKHAEAITVGRALELHLKFKKPSDGTSRCYKSGINTHLNDWLDKPLDGIRLHDVLAKGHAIADKVSMARANSVLSNLRCIWNTAKAYCDSNGLPCPGNPLKLVQVNAQFPVNRRKVVIPFNRVGEFIDLLETWKNKMSFSPVKRRTFRLYLFSLFLGMRHGEARNLKWAYIDMETCFFTLPGSVVKNKIDHIKPICSYAMDILRELREEVSPLNPYVFASTKYVDTAPISRDKDTFGLIREQMGMDFEHHALRRTFISLADEINTPRKVLKNLVNHLTGDVTDGYCVKGFNPQKEAPHLNRIQQALLALRDRHRNGEEVPEIAMDLFNRKGGSSREQLNALMKELEETRAALARSQARADKADQRLQEAQAS